jgi:hypothetical protein
VSADQQDVNRADEYNQYVAERVAAGMCPASGMSIKRCRASDLCDCFGWPGEQEVTE